MRFGRLAWAMDLVPYRHGEATRRDLAGARVLLDVGGGTGRVATRLAPARVLVLDLEPAMLARARGRGLDAVVGDAAHLPVKDGALDGVLMVDALHHFPEQDAAIREAARVLAPGGKLLVEEFDPASLGGRLIILAERALRFGSRFFAPAELRARVEAAGLSAESARRSARDHVVLGRRARVSEGGSTRLL